MIKRNVISADETLVLLNTPINDYRLTLLREWFATTKSHTPRFPLTDEIRIPESFSKPPPAAVLKEGEFDVRFAPNWKEITTTTVGRFVINNLLFARTQKLRENNPYYNFPFDGKAIGSVQQRLMDLLLEGLIDSDDVIWFIDRGQWLGYAPTSFVAPSMSIDTIRLPPKARKLKKEILNSERGDRLRGGDLAELARAEKEIIEMAKSEIGGTDPGFIIYESGARGSVGNNYKQTAVMRGAIRASHDPGNVDAMTISTASLEDGIPVNEMPAYADLLVQASYGRAVMTATGGYIGKQLNMAFQTLYLDPDINSDCGVKRTFTVEIDDPSEYKFRKFVKDGKILEILPSEMGRYKGQHLQMRSTLFCQHKNGFCATCAGTMFHRMGILRIGLIAGRIGTTLMNASLKAFHDTSLKLKRINVGDFMRPL